MINEEKASKAFRADLARAAYQDREKSNERNLPVTVREVEKLHPISVLKGYIMKWPPRDVRYDESVSRRVQSKGQDSPFMKDMFQGMDLRILKSDPINNTIEIGVYFQTNMAEFERYNIVAYHHNLKWIDNGMKEEVFDPVHGNITHVDDQFVNYAQADSEYISNPERNPFGTRSKGKLSQARPKAERTPILLVTYKLEIIGANFRLGYVCKDYRGRIVYYNEIHGNNLSDLTRRATQEIFGHPFIYSDKGPFLDGIPLLIQGKKLGICKRDNIEPDWMCGTIKNFNPNLEISRLIRFVFASLDFAFSVIFPLILLIWGIILKSLSIMNEKGPGIYLAYLTLVCGLMYGSVKVGSLFKRKAFDTHLQEKFL